MKNWFELKLINVVIGMLSFQSLYWYIKEVELWFVPLIMVANAVAFSYVCEGEEQ